MSALIYIILSAAGAQARFCLAELFDTRRFPWGVVAANFAACALLAVCARSGVSRRIRRVCGSVCGDSLDVFVAELRAVFDVARRAVFCRRRVFRVVGFDCRRRRLGVLIFYPRGCEQSGAFVCQILSKL